MIQQRLDIGYFLFYTTGWEFQKRWTLLLITPRQPILFSVILQIIEFLLKLPPKSRILKPRHTLIKILGVWKTECLHVSLILCGIHLCFNKESGGPPGFEKCHSMPISVFIRQNLRRWLKMDSDRVRHIIFKIQSYISKWLANGNFSQKSKIRKILIHSPQ